MYIQKVWDQVGCSQADGEQQLLPKEPEPQWVYYLQYIGTQRGGLASFRRKFLLGSSLEETVAKAFCKLCQHSQMSPKKALPFPWPWPRKGHVNLLSLTQERLCQFPWVWGTGVLLINTHSPKTTSPSASHNTTPWNIVCPGTYKGNCPFTLPSATHKRNREIRSFDTLKKSHSSEFLRKRCSVNTKPI